MLLLLSLLACELPPLDADDDGPEVSDVSSDPGNGVVPEVSRSRTVELPAGRAVVRSCFGAEQDSEGSAMSSPSPTPKRSASASGGAASPPPAAPSTASASSSASRTSGAAGVGPKGGVAGGVAGGTLGARGDNASGRKPVIVADRMAPEEAEAEPSMDGASSAKAEVQAAQPLASFADDSARAEEAKSTDEKDRDRASGPQIAWGGTHYLSNDDSMSLASAQRVLYAVKEGQRVSTSEIRPHELLNYFNFDLAPVARGELVGVRASAEQTDGETLTVALAVKGATPPRQPLDVTVVVDVSGSMWAEGRMDYVKRGLNVMAGSLVRGDRVNLVAFDHEVCTPLEDFVVDRDDPSLLTSAIASLTPRGSTNMNAGLQEGYRLAAQDVTKDEKKDYNHRVMVLTDAMLNTGDINPDTVTEISKAYEERGVRLTGVGVGREFNDKVLDKLTEKGKGAYVYLGSEAVVDRVFGLGFESLTRTIAHDVRFALNLPDSLCMKKFYGEESSTNPDDIQPIHYYSGTSQLFLQDLYIRDGRLKGGDDLTVTISYKDAVTGEAHEQMFRTKVGAMVEADRHNVDKARALMSFSDLLLERSMGSWSRCGPGMRCPETSFCGASLQTYKERAGAVQGDAEVDYVSGLVGGLCGVDMSTPPVAAGVSYKVRLDSDIPIAEVMIACSGRQDSKTLTSGSNIASFTVPPGPCALTLQGDVPMKASVEVPSTGGDVRCVVRAGRVSCS